MSQVKKFGEVFTPKYIVDKLLDGIDYSNPDLTICEPSFGDGRILLEVKTRLLEYHSEEHIMNNMLFGIEIQEAWYRETLERLNPNNYNHNLLFGLIPFAMIFYYLALSQSYIIIYINMILIWNLLKKGGNLETGRT